MNKKMAFLFPGQGAQYPGMGKDFYQNFRIAKDVFETADELLSTHFSRLIFEGPSQELTLTKNSQLAIYIVSFAILKTLCDQFPELKPHVCAGLSLGEYSALTAAQYFSFEEGLRLVQARAQFMNDACETTKGTMQVVLGLEASVVEGAIAALTPFHQVWVANLNCPGQVVIAGSLPGIEIAAVALKEKGAKRILPLEVSGAFHSGLMIEAQQRLKPCIQKTPLKKSDVHIVMNVPGDFVFDQEMIRENLIRQVTSPVRWEQGIRAMMRDEVGIYLEIGCGKTLLGMNKKIGVAVPTVSVETVTDLERLEGELALCTC